MAYSERGAAMNIYRISKNNISHYLNLLPTDFHHLAYMEEFVPFGIVDEEEDKAIPAGIMIVSDSNPHVYSIEWLYIAEEYQGQGLGDQMLEFVMDMARKTKREVVQLKNYRFEEDDGIDLPEGMYPVENFFLDRGFSGYNYGGMDKIYYFENLLKDSVYKEPPKCDDVISLGQLPSEALKEIKSAVAGKYKYSFDRSLDTESSMVIAKDGKVSTGLLVRRYGDTFVPLEFFTSEGKWDKKKIYKLIVAFLRKVNNEVGDKAFLHVCCDLYSPLSSFDGFFEKGSAIKAVALRAPYDAYERLIDNMRYEMSASKAAEKRLQEFPESAKIVEVEYFSGVKV